MSHFETKMHPIQFRSLQRSRRPPSWISGSPTSKGENGGEGNEREGRGCTKFVNHK